MHVVTIVYSSHYYVELFGISISDTREYHFLIASLCAPPRVINYCNVTRFPPSSSPEPLLETLLGDFSTLFIYNSLFTFRNLNCVLCFVIYDFARVELISIMSFLLSRSLSSLISHDQQHQQAISIAFTCVNIKLGEAKSESCDKSRKNINQVSNVFMTAIANSAQNILRSHRRCRFINSAELSQNFHQFTAGKKSAKLLPC